MSAAYTIITPDYWPQASTLAESIKKHNPKIQCFICIIGNKDSVQHEATTSTSNLLDTDSLDRKDFQEMRAQYSNFELSCALKPFFAELIIDRFDCDIVIYFDSDIFVFNSLSLVEEALQKNSIVITPHCLEPQTKENASMDFMLLKFGLYNAGFFGLRKSEIACQFLKWWQNKMLTECFIDLEHGRYVDQVWLNLVPVYFESVAILKDYGYNMAVWNLNERSLSNSGECFLVNKKVPLVFFHFSGYDSKDPAVISKNHTHITFEERPDVLPVFNEYKTALERNRAKHPQKIKTQQPPSKDKLKTKNIFYKNLQKWLAKR